MNPTRSLENLPEVFVSSSELSLVVSRGIDRGLLRPIAPKVYTRNLLDPPERIVHRNLWQLVAALVPGALIADRTTLDLLPAEDGSIFVVAGRKRTIELPGVTIRPRRGPPPLDTDAPFVGGLFLSSEARAYLDNLAPSRRRKGQVSRTHGPAELETRLEMKCRHTGVDSLNRLRDQARRIAPQIGREAEFRVLDGLIGALLGTRDEALATPGGRSRRAGLPFDPDRLRLFEALHRELRSTAPVTRLARDRGAAGRTTLAFFEAYFSNFIEGTRFEVKEAADIVFKNEIPRARPADAHDVAGTWRVVSDPVEMSRTPVDPGALVNILKHRHAILMAARPEKHPGAFKVEVNRAGDTVFVAPELVEGTLIQGLDLYRGLDSPFARAVFMMFLIAEVHPFTDGNGRTARIMMNAELVAAGEERIVIPTVYRDNYLGALKAMSRGSATALFRVLDFAQRWVVAVPWGGLHETTAALTACHAFKSPDEAEEEGVRLRLPGGLA